MSRRYQVVCTLILCSALVRRAAAESAPTPTVSISDVSVEEGDQGERSFSAQVQLQVGWYGPLTVDVTAVPGTADPMDYRFTTSRLTLTPGAAPVTVTGTITGDLTFEGDESFRLQAVNAGLPGPSWYPYTSGGQVTIRDDDQARASRLSIQGASVDEGNQGTTSVPLPVTLIPAADRPVSVDYFYAGPNSSSQNGTLQFAPGQTSQTISVLVAGNTVWSMERRIVVQLSNARGALIATDRAEVLVRDDDAPSVVSLADVTVAEGNAGVTPVTLTFKYDRPTPPQTKLWVRTEAGLAVPGRDYRAIADTFYPPDGATTFTVTLELLGDTVAECDEGLTLRFAGVYTGDETQKTARVTVTNDDGPRATSGACPDAFTPDPNAPAEPEPKPADPAAEPPPDGGAGGSGGSGGSNGGTATTDAAVDRPLASNPPPGSGCSHAPGSLASDGPAALLGLSLLALAIIMRSQRRRRSP